MGKIVSRVVIWIVLLGLVWLTGDRYGAPNWLSGIVAPGFSFIENLAGGNGDYKGDDSEADPEKTLPDNRSALAEADSKVVSGKSENATLRINKAGLEIIKASEGFRLEAYSVGGKSYIGYGHQMKPGEPSIITEAQATGLLREDLKTAEEIVRKRLTRQANGNQFSAMVSLAYNLGAGAFGRSLVHKYFNEGKEQAAADAFRNHNLAGGKVSTELIGRREKERALFLTPA